ncbi:DUF6484 domain-containing protein [Pseudomonas sp. RW409]|uniref:DUF6484 domain-containing protein n=1 Tax=Pseudomonas sp. RW409 TaxID=2202895 RepID=UPI000D930C67|nr:DUF6484 domain-containing protein [Pseudomonas sp. RW409]PWY36401.1 hypothetical protein DK261_28260 [Pseudomonas sp. RW409]
MSYLKINIPKRAQEKVSISPQGTHPASFLSTALKQSTPIDFHSSVTGRLLGMIDDGQIPLVSWSEQEASVALPARSIVDLRNDHVGREVLLMFEQADQSRPIIIGVLRTKENRPQALVPLEVRYDGGRVLLDADTELVLRCGKSHLTLRQDGRVEVYGETIVTRAAGANKVQGGSVQLN